jgi:hypothetical protein
VKGKRGDFTRSRNDSRAESLTAARMFKCLDASPFFHVRASTTMALIGARMFVSPNRSAIA